MLRLANDLYFILCNDTGKKGDNGKAVEKSPLWARYVVSFWSMNFSVYSSV